ncbi:MAG: MFS transporter, partial [Rhodococcus sp. (in: high G+C Gram-positive bacteria)]
MKTLLTQFRSFDRPSQVLMVNQFSINVGFYMLMPYLAGYLAGPLGLAAWAVGLVLGMRNFSQQGMFLLGGTLADRLGYKPLIVAGCLLRVAGFVLLAAAESLPAILLASAATGFAGALFNPAVRAYLAADAGPRRVEAFAVFNVFYQAGILLGPLIGLALTTLDFRVTSLAAAAIFAVLTIVQIWTLPAHRAETAGATTSVLEDWRLVMSNRPFVLFALAMIGSYVLSFQIYLALPLQAAVVVGDGRSDTALVTSLFVVSGVVAIAGQFRITSWLSRRWGSGRSV